MSIKDWKKLGYSYEQSEELERLSHIGNDMGDIDVHVVDKMLQETMRKYELEKENNNMNNTTNFEKTLGKQNANVGEAIMNNKANLGKSLKEQLTDACDKFSKWISESQSVMNSIKNIKSAIEEINEIDDALVELQKVSDDTVKEITE